MTDHLESKMNRMEKMTYVAKALAEVVDILGKEDWCMDQMQNLCLVTISVQDEAHRLLTEAIVEHKEAPRDDKWFDLACSLTKLPTKE